MKTAYEILKEAEKMSKEVIAAEADGKVIGLSEEVADGAEVKPLTFADKEGKKVSRAELLAERAQEKKVKVSRD